MKYFITTSVRLNQAPFFDDVTHVVKERIEAIMYVKTRGWALLNIVEITEEEFLKIKEYVEGLND